MDLGRLKHADKKSLKQWDFCNKLACHNPFTSIVPPTMTDPDLWNLYLIIGICRISRRSTPVRYLINKQWDFCNKPACHDPFTSIVPSTMTDPDLWNLYLIIDICRISRRSTPVRYLIKESTVIAELFTMEMEDAVAYWFLQPGNVFMMENIANHTGKENTVLEDWLWMN